jgi:predicted transcriptional regulator
MADKPKLVVLPNAFQGYEIQAVNLLEQARSNGRDYDCVKRDLRQLVRKLVEAVKKK